MSGPGAPRARFRGPSTFCAAPLTIVLHFNGSARGAPICSPRMRPRATALILAVLALLLCACGGDKAPSKAEFIKRADRDCRESRERFQAVQLEARGLSGLPARQALMKAAPLFQQVRTEAGSLLSKLRDRKPPKGDEMVIDRYLQARDNQLRDLDQLIAAAREGSTAKFRASLVALQATGRTLQGIAQGYGFKVCVGAINR